MYKISVKIERVNTAVRRVRPSEPETSTTEVLVVVLADNVVDGLAKAQNLLVAEMTWREHERPQLRIGREKIDEEEEEPGE